jgi:hypothetical protein
MFSFKPPWLTPLFWGLLAIAVLVYLLRGFTFLSMIPGFIAIALLMAAVSLGVYLALVSLR